MDRNDLNRDCLINSESAKILEMTHLNNDETGNDSRRKQLLCEELKGRDGEEGTVASSDNTSHDVKNSEDVSGISARHSKNGEQQIDMTLEDIYNGHYDFNDEDDDSDWDPLEKEVEVVKWFCVNCTMVNLSDVVHCDICGEHKDSGILRFGYFASPFLPKGDITENELEATERSKDSRLKGSSSDSTVVGFDERMLLHAEVEMKSHPHPERPDRLRAIAASLASAGIFPGKCYPISAREITREELLMVHALENVEAVELTSRLHASYFTPDTYANEYSARAARLAAGLCADLASTIISGGAKNGFALVRPPGHHAGVKQAMGFCLHNNAAVAAFAAHSAGAKKVLIVDWDVHHGNGTQEIFDRSKSVLYISLHRHEDGRFYPGTGAAEEVGSMGAAGYCVNIPWSRGGVGDNDYVFAFQHIVLPIALEFAPDFTIISAGFDAARGDPLGCCDVTPAGYALMTQMLTDLSGGKLLVILEGGYNLRSISSSATAVIKVLLGESPEANPDCTVPSKSGLRSVMEVMKIQMNFWPTLESNFNKILSRWGLYAFQNTRKPTKKKRRAVVPIWWRWGRKRFLYHLLTKRLHLKSKRY
ncbi:histone deacetylase 15 isoform X2 [Ipomoea triloba]|uniref:histone deacetylase 15 isoform X2 n=1 Tax=Ipomoea triloba TaxID=35885 RepID=UPI00125E348E|nr:histone deacetylase 15 isoform X2 [Ipomoea triloba]